MQNVTVPVERFEVQLENHWVTTPVEVRLEQDSVEVCVSAGENQYNYEFALVDANVMLIVRKMVDGKLTMTQELIVR